MWEKKTLQMWLRILRWKDYPRLSMWAQCKLKGSYKMERDSRCDDKRKRMAFVQNSKCIRLVWGKLKLKECEKLGSSWKMVKSSAFQRASSFLQLWVLPQRLRMPKAQLFLCSLQGISSQDFKAFTVSQSLCLLCRWSSAFRTSIENKVPNTGHWVIL